MSGIFSIFTLYLSLNEKFGKLQEAFSLTGKIFLHTFSVRQYLFMNSIRILEYNFIGGN